jgi:2-polyprenyl-6-methoxyphenol hydroxylase-like FAD-dependent oxidoreductase
MLKVVVAGGSIGGLCAGIALRGIGCDVDIYERTSGPMTGRGAGIVVQEQLLQLLHRHGAPDLPITKCQYRQYLRPDGGDGIKTEMPLQFTSWHSIYETLRSTFPDEHYHSDSTLVGFTQSDTRIFARFAKREYVKADLLICADGSRSETRRQLLPNVQPAYSGYVAWRGTIEEASAPGLARFFDWSFSICEGRSGGHILSYLIPGADACTEEGRRHLNWVWYVSAPNLERLLIDKHGIRHEASVPVGMVPSELVAEIHATAARELHPYFHELVQRTRDPFIQAIVDVVTPQMAFGRLCLLGDAAFVLRPHLAAATAKAAADASVLAAALAANPAGPPVALRAWETRQLAYGRSLSDQAIEVGKRSVQQHASSCTMGDVVERFRGISPLLPAV